MVSKHKIRFFVRNVDMRVSWLGRCPGCNSWNTFVEERVSSSKEKNIWSVLVTGKVSHPFK